MTENYQQVDKSGRQRPASLADMVSTSEPVSFRLSFPPSALVKMLALAALVLGMNYRQFPMMLRDWRDDPNWSHGFLIPLFSLYLLYNRRHDLLRARRKTCLWGLPAVILACMLQILAYWVQNPWSCQIAMTLLLLSLVLYLAGWEMTRITWLPILFLIFSMPISPFYYTQIAEPLQELAAFGSWAILRVFGVAIQVSASSLTITSRSGITYPPLTVAEACSGMRLLMAFLALSVATAYLEDRPIWQRVVLVVLGIPVAIACNVLRVAITCEMYVLDSPQFGQKFMHEFTGMLMLIPAFAILWFVGWLMRNLFVEADEEQPEGPAGSREAPA